MQALGSPMDLDVRSARRLLLNIELINVQPVHSHVNWAWNFIMTISRSRIYYGSLGISQPIIYSCQQWHIHLYFHTLISTMHLYQHTLISTIYLYLQPVNTSNTSNTSKLISVIASKTVITFHIIHYQILRHQECVHSPECNQYWKPFHDSTSEKCALSSGVCHVGSIHTQEIGHNGNESKHVLHIQFNN